MDVEQIGLTFMKRLRDTNDETGSAFSPYPGAIVNIYFYRASKTGFISV